MRLSKPSYGSCVHEFRTAKLRRGSRTFAHDQVRRRWSKIITTFQWVLIFEQSVNRRRGPRWWPQIGAAATRLWVFSRYRGGLVGVALRSPLLTFTPIIIAPKRRCPALPIGSAADESMVRRFAAGGRWIRTIGPIGERQLDSVKGGAAVHES